MATKSSFRGVDRKGTGTWTANIRVKGVRRYLGSFDNEVDAAKAYDRAATKLHKGPILNFREDGSLNPHRKDAKSSSYRGVCISREGKWEAKIRVDGRRCFLGRFEDEAEAARAYDRAVREWKVERPLNFPDRGGGAGTVASTAASRDSDAESLWSSDEDGACENEEEDEDEGEEEEQHSDGDHKEDVKQESPSLQPRKRPRTHDPPTPPTSVLLVATQSSGSCRSTPTTPEPSSSESSVHPAMSPLASASSASSTSRAAVADLVTQSSSPPTTSATRASVSVGAIPTVCPNDAVTQLRHAVTAARMEATSKEPAEQERIVQAFAVLRKRELQEEIKEFAERTITNAYAPLDTRREKDRALLLQLFIESFLVES